LPQILQSISQAKLFASSLLYLSFFKLCLSHRNSVRPSVCHTGGSVKNGAR